MSNTKPVRHPQRRWRIAPPLAQRSDVLPGMRVLAEHPGELGGLLWRALQGVLLWAAVPAADRAGLFAPGAEEERLADLLAAAPEPPLEAALRTLIGLVARPERANSEQVGLACVRVAQWAAERGAHGTHAEFLHAAAAACPGDASLSLKVGRAHRDRGEYPVAEGWYQRSIGLARQAGEWNTYAWAWGGLGKIAQAKGAYPAARKSLLKALRAAERRGLREFRAMILHDLFTVEMECNRHEEAEQYALASLYGYGVGHRNVPILACDIAIFWIESQGRFEEALGVLHRILPQLHGEVRLLMLGQIARAAGATGDADVYEGAYYEVMATPEEMPRLVDALHALAHGAVNLGRLDEAERVAGRALVIATARRESKTVFTLEAILADVTSRRRASVREASSASVYGAEHELVASPLLQPLQRMLVAQPAEI